MVQSSSEKAASTYLWFNLLAKNRRMNNKEKMKNWMKRLDMIIGEKDEKMHEKLA